ncbi:hypothetical protein [Paraliobacillus sp. X-1268]|uniref:hypothetical protein n=1 Tax=Paraliobacillus sp. X-1268 TaxID=2213193 RepID=UPI000E3CE55B|nr:hypothetical protein [Paraliobacillus sp. X-1268]
MSDQNDNKKTPASQLKASRNWEQKNRKKATIANYKRSARSFIKNHADQEDLEELKSLIIERENLLGV